VGIIACKESVSLYLTERQGLPLALSSPKAGNHHDLHEIKVALDEMFCTLEKSVIPLDGLFINADSGFDSGIFRLAVQKEVFLRMSVLIPAMAKIMNISICWMMNCIKRDIALR
jgi:hypothetical protein